MIYEDISLESELKKYYGDNLGKTLVDAILEQGYQTKVFYGKLIGSGMTCCVFSFGNDMVVKIINKDELDPEAPQRVNHPRVLQPKSKKTVVNDLYIVEVYDKLNTKDVSDTHINELAKIFEKDGFEFSDAKKENIGLDKKGVPYVIDGDAVVALSHQSRLRRSKNEISLSIEI